MSGIKIHKQDLAQFIILIDLISIFSVAIFMMVLKKRQLEFIRAFKIETIQMDDYALRISNLPKISTYRGDQNVLKA